MIGASKTEKEMCGVSPTSKYNPTADYVFAYEAGSRVTHKPDEAVRDLLEMILGLLTLGSNLFQAQSLTQKKSYQGGTFASVLHGDMPRSAHAGTTHIVREILVSSKYR